MVARFHDAGLEVILDVVYNHTAEGNERGPTLSFKGIDNASYYRLLPDNPRYYINDTGTGNTLNLSHPGVIQMVTDSLRYWVNELHVDGFRFDLGTILAREPNGFDNQSGFLKACHQDPVLRTVKLIAEPWDCRPGRLSGRAAFRPAGRSGMTAIATWCAISGRAQPRPVRWRSGCAPPATCSIISGAARRRASISSLPTMASRSTTWCPTTTSTTTPTARTTATAATTTARGIAASRARRDDPAVNPLRARQMRNMLATLLLSQGTPMLLAGDEFGRTQQGNNNAYCQDNAISWVDWKLAAGNAAQIRLVQKLTALRHKYPILRRNRFLTGAYDEELEVKDLTWINASGAEMKSEDWGDGNMRCFGMLMDGRARPTGVRQRGTEATMLLVLNAHHDLVQFTLPACPGGEHWSVVLDTNAPESETTESFAAGDSYQVTGRSLLLFALG